MGFFLVGPPRGGHSRGLPRGNPSWRRQLGFLLWWSKWSTVALAKQWSKWSPGDQDGFLPGRTPQGGPLEGATTGEPILAAPTWPPTVVEQVVYRGPALGTKMDFLLVGPASGGH